MKRYVPFSLLLMIAALSPAFGGPAGKSSNTDLQDELRLKVGDEKVNESKSYKAELLISRAEDQALAQLNKLIKKYEGTSTEPDLLFRKAELFIRKSKTLTFFELFKDNEGGLVTPTSVKQEQSSARNIQSAIDTYGIIEKKFPKYHDLDAVLFNQAFAVQNLGKASLAETAYQQLIKQFPESTFIADAELAIGDMAFEKKKIAVALEHYDRIKKYPTSRVYPYGIYKAGWARYNLGQLDDALVDLEKVIHLSEENDDGSNRLNLRKEALGDMVVFAKEAKPADSVLKYILKFAKADEIGTLALKLATLYDRHSEPEYVRVVLEQFLDKFPEAAEAPKARRDLIASFDRLKKYDKAADQLDEFSKGCLKLEDLKQDECHKMLWETSIRFSGQWHKLWAKSDRKDSTLAKVTQRAYEVYLATSEKDKVTTQNSVRYAYAEFLFQNNDDFKSSQAYEKVSLLSTDPIQKHDSAYGAILALQRAVGSKKWADTEEANLGRLVQFYCTKTVKPIYKNEVTLKLGSVKYDKEKYDESLKVLEPLSIQTASVEVQEKAQDLILDILNIRKDLQALKKTAQRYIATTRRPERQANLETIAQQSMIAQAEKVEATGDIKSALALYQGFLKEYETSQWSEKVLMKLCPLQEKVGQYMDAAHSYGRFVEKYPKSKDSQSLLLKSINLYEQMGRSDLVLQGLSKLKSIEGVWNPDYEFLTITHLLLVGDSERALLKLIPLAQNKDKKISQVATLRIQGLIKEHQKDSWLSKLTEKSDVPQFQVLQKMNQLRNAQESGNTPEVIFKLSSQIQSMPEADPSQKAEARFSQATILADEHRQQSLKTRPDRVAIVLAMKTEKLDKAQRAYQDVIRMKIPQQQVKSLIALADLYHQFIVDVRAMTLGEIPESELKAFRKELDTLVSPFEEKEVDVVQAALEVSKKQFINVGAIVSMQARLDKLNMKAPTTQGSAAKAFVLKDLEPLIPLDAVDLPKGFRSAFVAKKYDQAKKIAQEEMDRDIQSPMGPYLMSLVMTQTNQRQNGLWFLDLAESRKKTTGVFGQDIPMALFHYEKARIFFSDGSTLAAVDEAQASISSGERSGLAYFFLGAMSLQVQDVSKAKTYFEKAKNINNRINGLSEAMLVGRIE